MSRGYPHLAGSYHQPRAVLLQRLNALGSYLGKTIDITSGRRSLREQSYLYANRASNPYPVAAPSPNSPHIEGVAADATIDGRPIQDVVPAATLRKFGLEGLSGDAVHVQIKGTIGKTADQIRRMAEEGRFKLRGSSSGGEDEGPYIPGISEAAKFLDENVPGYDAAAHATSDVLDAVPNLLGGAAEDVGKEVVGYMGDLVGSHAEALMLNIGLIGGGAFLVYYGAALMLGVKNPGSKITQAGMLAATRGAVK